MNDTRLRLCGVVGIVILVLTLGFLEGERAQPVHAATFATLTPGPGAMSIYEVTNPNANTLTVQQTFNGPNGFTYSLWSQVPPNSSRTIHVSNIPQIPSPFNGTVQITADGPFTAQIIGYDYPPSSVTATPTTTVRLTTTATPTATVGGASAPREVQSALGYTANMVNRQSAAFTNPVASGDLIVVAIASWNSNNTATVSSITDSAGNTYSKAVEDPSPATSGIEPLSIWYAANVVGGSNLTVSANLQSTGNLTVAIHEYQGIATSNVVDQVAHASGTSTLASSGPSASTAHANDLLFGAATLSDAASFSATAGSGYTLRQSQTDNGCCDAMYTEDGVGSSLGQYAATLGFSQSVDYRAALVAFVPAGSGSPSPTPSSTPTLSATPAQTSSPTASPTASPAMATSTPTSTSTVQPISNLTSTVTPTAIASAPRYIQSALGYTGAATVSQSATFPNPVSSGDLVVVAISSWNNKNTAVVSSVTDSAGNTYVKAVDDPSPATSGVEPISVWYATDVIGSPTLSVTANLPASGTLSVAIHDYSGIGRSIGIDQVAYASGSGSAASAVPSGPTSAANDLLFSAATFSDSAIVNATAGPGDTLRQSQSNNAFISRGASSGCSTSLFHLRYCDALFTEDGTSASPGSYAGAFNFPQSVTWRAVFVAFLER